MNQTFLMNIQGNGYSLGAELYRDEQQAHQFPHGGGLPDTPEPVPDHPYVPCVLPCPNPGCPYYGWLRTGEFVIGRPGWDCEAFLETLLYQIEPPAALPERRPAPAPRPRVTLG